MATNEFEIIERYFACRALKRQDVDIGIGDDAAVVRVPPDTRLVTTVDTLVENVHFPPSISGHDIGHRALAVNLSDLAAMGAEPAWALLSLTVPEPDEGWLTQFADGFAGLARSSNTALIGGDLNRGPLAVSVTLHGFLPAGAALTRNGASAGDVLYVTGTLGEAACGLEILTAGVTDELHHDASRAVKQFLRPQPRWREGRDLLELASAAIDISDGLLIDAERLAAASAVSAELDAGRVPVSDLVATIRGHEAALHYALNGGDDYELCFAVPPDKHAELKRVTATWACRCTAIGTLKVGSGLTVWQDGARMTPTRRGYDHFADGDR